MRSRVASLYYLGMYYASWVAFGLVGLALNLACLPFLLLPGTPRQRWLTRRVIRRLFDLWTRWFHATGVMRVRWVGFGPDLPTGAVYVANHPTLLDATLLLSRMPEAFCIFKPALMRNPAIAPAAILAGYEAGENGIDTIRQAALKVRSGESLLVFPEGTRTALGQRVAPLRSGFALIAVRGQAAVQLIVIRSSPGLVRRGRAWWRPPAVLPAWIEFERSEVWPYEPERSAADLAAAVCARLQRQLADPVL